VQGVLQKKSTDFTGVEANSPCTSFRKTLPSHLPCRRGLGVKLHGVILNMVLKYAIKKKAMVLNPASDANVPAQDGSFKGKFYSVEQANKLLEKCAEEMIYSIVYLVVGVVIQNFFEKQAISTDKG
jgi:hypothetical protein